MPSSMSGTVTDVQVFTRDGSDRNERALQVKDSQLELYKKQQDEQVDVYKKVLFCEKRIDEHTQKWFPAQNYIFLRN